MDLFWYWGLWLQCLISVCCLLFNSNSWWLSSKLQNFTLDSICYTFILPNEKKPLFFGIKTMGELGPFKKILYSLLSTRIILSCLRGSPLVPPIWVTSLIRFYFCILYYSLCQLSPWRIFPFINRVLLTLFRRNSLHVV